MPRIAPVTDDTALAAARPLLAAIKQRFGMVPNLFATIAHSPESLSSLLAAIDALSKGALSAREVELVNLAVSEANGCGYCVSAHAALGKRAGLSPEDVERARRGDASSPREHAMLDLARRVVRTGGVGAGTDFAQAREHGLGDREIVEVLAHVALKAFTNAIAIVAQTDIDFPKAPHLPSP